MERKNFGTRNVDNKEVLVASLKPLPLLFMPRDFIGKPLLYQVRKCVCDPEGGSLKAAADAHESKDSPLGDRRSFLRDAHEIVMFGREQLSKPSSRDFFAKEGNCVYRRFSTLFL